MLTPMTYQTSVLMKFQTLAAACHYYRHQGNRQPVCSVREAADDFGISKSRWHAYERGERPLAPSVKNDALIGRMARAFQVPEADFVDWYRAYERYA